MMKTKYDKYITTYLVLSCFALVWWGNQLLGSGANTFLAVLLIQLANVKASRWFLTRLLLPNKFFKKNFLETKENGEIRIVANVENLIKNKYKGKAIPEVLNAEQESLSQVLLGLVKTDLESHFDFGVYLNENKVNSFIYKIVPKTEIAKAFTHKIREVFEEESLPF